MTPEQRRQALQFGSNFGTGIPIPISDIPASSRSHVVNLYYQIPSVQQAIFFWRNKNRLSNVWQSKTAPVNVWRSKTAPVNAWQSKTPPPDSNTQVI